MSRLGKKPILIPSPVQAQVEGRQVCIQGPFGELRESLPEGVEAILKKGQILVRLVSAPGRQGTSLLGLTRARLANMVQGVTKNFSKVLEIQGLGFRAQSVPGKLVLQIGYSHPVEFPLPPGIQVQVDAKQSQVTVLGANKDLVGQVAAQIRSLRPPEPYKGTGIRYAGEHLLRKAGKTAAGLGAGGGAKK